VAGREESSFFEKKEAKKLFSLGIRGLRLTGLLYGRGPSGQKFFASFFQKRRCFLAAPR
jgi:hypothetical protein